MMRVIRFRPALFFHVVAAQIQGHGSPALALAAASKIAGVEQESSLVPEEGGGAPRRDSRIVVVAGATGRTGQLIFRDLKARKANYVDEDEINPRRQELQASSVYQVRALVRDLAKAREVLNCTHGCDEAHDGVFVGDITKPATLSTVMANATTLIIATSAMPHCPKPFKNPADCTYPANGWPKDVDWDGARNLVKSFMMREDVDEQQDRTDGDRRLRMERSLPVVRGASNNSQALVVEVAEKEGAAAPAAKKNSITTSKKKSVVLISAMGTTEPDGFLDEMGPKGWISFYKLNFEAWLAASNVRNVILKPCGLSDNPDFAAKNPEFAIGHDDEEKEVGGLNSAARNRVMTRAQLSEIAVASAVDWTSGSLRFDVCTKPGRKNSDLLAVLKSAEWPWESTTARRTDHGVRSRNANSEEVFA